MKSAFVVCSLYRFSIIQGGFFMVPQTQEDPQLDEEQKEEGQDQFADLLTVHEVAQQLRVDDTTVRRWIKSGALPALPLPHSGKRCGYRIRRHTLEALLNPPPATPPAPASAEPEPAPAE
jgi:excisionase family DNA binding protein